MRLNSQHSTVGGRAASYPAGATQLPGEGQVKLAADRIQGKKAEKRCDGPEAAPYLP